MPRKGNHHRKRCGAKCRNTGQRCRQWAMRNGRCRMHGGKSPGVPGNRNAWKHGIYSRYMTAKDKELLAVMTSGELTDEIGVLKVQLARAVEAQAKADEAAANDPAAGLDIESIMAGTGPASETRQVFPRRRDYDDIICRLAQRIKDLTLAQEMLLKEGAGAPGTIRTIVDLIRLAGES